LLQCVKWSLLNEIWGDVQPNTTQEGDQGHMILVKLLKLAKIFIQIKLFNIASNSWWNK
jgi:hypothetical protein